MIKNPKKQFFSPHFLLAILLLPLVGFFVYAKVYQPHFFIFLALALLACILLLVSLHIRLIKKQAEISLQKQDYLERVNLIEAEILKQEQTIEALRQKIINHALLKELTEKLTMCLTLEDTSLALSSEVSQLWSDDVTIILYLFHHEKRELGIISSQKGQYHINLKAKKGDVFDQWVVKTMQPLLIEDTRNDFRFDLDKIILEEYRPIRSVMSVPLIVHHKPIGILRVDCPQEKEFTTEDLRLLMTMGDVGAMAIENAQLYEKLEDLAIRDSLTRLYLRRYLLDRLPQEIGRVLRRKQELSFLMIDIDNFKQYNDKFGHMAGDIVLRTAGMILREIFQAPGDLVCRYGGEEFVVILPDCPKPKAVELAEEVRKRIELQSIILRREKTSITVSVGVATFPKDAQIKEELIQQADYALYSAKQSGKNKVCTV